MEKVDGRSRRDKNTYYYCDLKGQRFGKLTVLECVGVNKYGSKLWRCKCDCGKEHIAASGKLKQGKTRSCGCLPSEIHGYTTGGKPRTLIIWSGMKARCYNPKCISYQNYGARGIDVCKEWLGKDGFKNFHEWAMSSGYDDTLQIDRIDNDKGYYPGNCRWVSRETNNSNQRKTRKITIDGETMCLSHWLKKLNVSKSAAYKALHESEECLLRLLKAKKGAAS